MRPDRSPAARLAHVLALALALSPAAAPQQPGRRPAPPPAQDGAGREDAAETQARALIGRGLERSTADLSELRRRGFVRVLTTYDHSTYCVVAGEQRGFEVELLRGWEEELNAGRPAGAPELRLVYVPVPFELLIPALLAGQGDVVAAGLSVTPECAAQVAFAEPYLPAVRGVVVAGAGVQGLERVEDLSGRAVFVTEGTVQAADLRDCSAGLVAAGRPAIDVREVDPTIGDEDLLGLVDRRVLALTVCDEHVARMWSRALPGLDVRDDLALGPPRALAWAVRPENPELRASLSAHAARARKGSLLGNLAFRRSFESERWLGDALGPEGRAGLDALVGILRAAAAEHGFDWLQIAAQAFGESRFDPQARSAAGAVGLMQLTAATAEEMGCADRSDPAQNVAAGVKYMAWLRDRCFAGENLSPAVRFDFCLAAYNAGIGNVRRWRAAAPERGFDPDRWFGHVEHIAQEAVGDEPVRYVAEVNRLYFAYRMSMNLVAHRERALEALEAAARER